MTTRDWKIIDYVSEYKAVSTSMIACMFFDNRKPYAYKRLQKLVEWGHLKCARISEGSINSENVYFTGSKPPAQLRHTLAKTWFIIMFGKRYRICKVENELKLNGLRPDLVITYIDNNGNEQVACVEIELSNNGFNFLKYENYYASNAWRNEFRNFPQVFLIGKGNLPNGRTRINYLKFKFDETMKVL